MWTWVSQYQNVSILDFLELRMMEMVVTTGAIRHAELRSEHHQQVNTQFLQARCPSCRPTNSVWSLKEKASHFMDTITPSSPRGIPNLTLTTKSSWLLWRRVARPLISPPTPIVKTVLHYNFGFGFLCIMYDTLRWLCRFVWRSVVHTAISANVERGGGCSKWCHQARQYWHASRSLESVHYHRSDCCSDNLTSLISRLLRVEAGMRLPS